MRFPDQKSAKSYFVDIVIKQAERDGISLTEAERYMLAWSESDPFFVLNEKLNDQFNQEIPPKDYEIKIQDLIKRAYQGDVESLATAKKAYSVLNKGDHYILVMLRAALGLKLNKWWPF